MAVTYPYIRAATWADGSTTDTAAKRNTMEDGIFNAHQQPAVHVFHNAAQNISNNVATALAFNSERFDQAGGAASTQHDTVTNNSRLTCRYAGIYIIGANIGWGANGTAFRNVTIKLNNTTTIGEIHEIVATASFGSQMQLTTLYSLAVNDFVECVVTQTSGGVLAVASTANVSPEFWMARVA